MLFFAFILMCGFINLMIGSASAQWAVTAPIFVPMLMLVAPHLTAGHKYQQQGTLTNGTAYDLVGRAYYAGVKLNF